MKVILKSTSLWDVMACSLVEICRQCFEGIQSVFEVEE
jgi:hypothetical protein